VHCATAITANCQAHCVVLSHQVSLNAYACQPCRQDVTRMLSKSYASRWRETTSKRSACCVIDCTDNVFVSLHKGSDLLQFAFEAGELRHCECEVPIPSPLCKHHYHSVYNGTTNAKHHNPTLQTSLPLCKHHYHCVYEYRQPTQTHCIT